MSEGAVNSKTQSKSGTSNTFNSRAIAVGHLDAENVTRTSSISSGSMVTAFSITGRNENLINQSRRTIQQNRNRGLNLYGDAERTINEARIVIEKPILRRLDRIEKLEAELQDLNNRWNIFGTLTEKRTKVSAQIVAERQFLSRQESALKEFDDVTVNFKNRNAEYKSGAKLVNLELDKLTADLISRAESVQKQSEIITTGRVSKFREGFSKYSSSNFFGRLYSGVGFLFSKTCSGIKESVFSGCDLIFSAKTYSDIGSSISNGFKSTWRAIKSATYSCSDFLTSAGTWKSAWNGICGAISSTWNFLTSPSTWVSAWKGIVKACNATVNFLSNPHMWKTLWNSTCSAIKSLCDPASWRAIGVATLKSCGSYLKFCGEVLINPNKAWDNLCKSLNSTYIELGERVPVLGSLWNATKATLSFIKSVSDSIGITDIVAGLFNLASLPFRSVYALGKFAISTGSNLLSFAKGDLSINQLSSNVSKSFKELKGEIGSALKESLRLFKGLVRLCFEVTGLADLGRACYYGFIVGDWKKAGIYAAMGVIQLATTILTLGVGAVTVAAIRETLKRGCIEIGKKCLSVVGKQIGEVVGKEVVEKGSMEVLKKGAISSADSLAEEIVKKGLSRTTIENLAKEVSHKEFKAAFQKIGHEEMVYKHSKQILQSAIDDPMALAKTLQADFGKSKAKRMAFEMRNLLASEKHLDDVTKILVKDISDSLYEKMATELEKAFADRFRANLLGQVDSTASKKLAVMVDNEVARSRIAKSKLVDEYVLKATEGFKKGLRQALEEVVEAGVRRALKDSRFKKEEHTSSIYSDKEQDKKRSIMPVTAISGLSAESSNLKESKYLEASKEQFVYSPHSKQLRAALILEDGKTFEVREELIGGKWVKTGKKLIEEHITPSKQEKKKELIAA